MISGGSAILKFMHPRKFWIWTGPSKNLSKQELQKKYKNLASRGIDAVFLEHGIYEPEFEAIKEAGLELHSWMWTVNRGEQWIRDNHPDWFQVSRSGKSCFDQPPYVDYYRWVCPSNPAVQDYLAEKARELATHPLVDGVHLDYVRYPDVILPRGLWRKYNLDQTEELPDYDFCYSEATREAYKERYGVDPLEIKDPAHDQQWLHFRYDTITRLVHRLTDVVHNAHKQITAAVFPTPSMARKICRQSWDKWPLDAVCPMLYNKFYDEEVEWIGDCMRENIGSVTFPIYAGLFLQDFKPGDLEKAIAVSLKRGAKGVSLFGNPSEELWKEFEKAISH